MFVCCYLISGFFTPLPVRERPDADEALLLVSPCIFFNLAVLPVSFMLLSFLYIDGTSIAD